MTLEKPKKEPSFLVMIHDAPRYMRVCLCCKKKAVCLPFIDARFSTPSERIIDEE
jgi:hypothetical protein